MPTHIAILREIIRYDDTYMTHTPSVMIRGEHEHDLH